MTTQGRRVIALAPMPPEKSAYALARYSRSPDSIEESIKWVHGHSSEKFWEQFYFDYGHGSIADLGHVIICFEQISELAAIRLEDEPAVGRAGQVEPVSELRVDQLVRAGYHSRAGDGSDLSRHSPKSRDGLPCPP
jgi:hypothetical protein